jgi:hypothetical protein
MILSPKKIYITSSTISGLGVFASVEIEEDETIEEAPILEIPEEQIEDLAKTELLKLFFWGRRRF